MTGGLVAEQTSSPRLAEVERAFPENPFLTARFARALEALGGRALLLTAPPRDGQAQCGGGLVVSDRHGAAGMLLVSASPGDRRGGLPLGRPPRQPLRPAHHPGHRWRRGSRGGGGALF